MQTGSLLKDVVASQTLDGTNPRFILSEVLRKNKTEPEAKDGSDTEDDDDGDDDEEEVEEEDDDEDEPPAKKRK
ncbi:hypothetical protein Tco_0990270 [Tanacetum coccineum]|uniref:Uncharacterized protein n=1 Tax=Tanacetum coccineum TaxID=301880 RepID=A0ABQ5EVZ8_9ASTR